jgi:hypothetical protein
MKSDESVWNTLYKQVGYSIKYTLSVIYNYYKYQKQ